MHIDGNSVTTVLVATHLVDIHEIITKNAHLSLLHNGTKIYLR